MSANGELRYRAGLDQVIARRLAVSASACCFSASACCKAGPSSILGSARRHREVFPTELTSDEEMVRDLGEWRRVNVLNECDCMKVCYKI